MTVRRVALVTGGASGIGRACALAFARSHMDLAIVDIDEKKTQQVCAEVAKLGSTALALPCDASDEAAVQAAMQRIEDKYHRLDVLVMAAGVDLHKSVENTSLDEWQRVIKVNLTGSFLGIKHARRLMAANKYGRIVCLGSVAGVIGMGYPAYSAAKAGLLGLVRSAGRDLGPLGITANVVVIGPTDTPLTAALWNSDVGRRERLASRLAVGRIASAEEIAGAIEYLVGENSGFVTGSQLVIDGGLTSILRM